MSQEDPSFSEGDEFRQEREAMRCIRACMEELLTRITDEDRRAARDISPVGMIDAKEIMKRLLAREPNLAASVMVFVLQLVAANDGNRLRVFLA